MDNNSKVTIGLWIDDPTSYLVKESYWNDIQKIGVKTTAIMLLTVDKKFQPRYKLEDLEKIKVMALERDIETVLTLWPYANPVYLDGMEQNVGRYIEALGAAALETDLEGNWRERTVSGFQNIDKAGDRLVEILNKCKEKYDVRTEVTTFLEHPEDGKKADVANHVDRLLPQAYSVRNRNEGPIPYDHMYGPGRMQKLTMDKAKTVPGNHKVCCGLAAYDQTWPDHTAQQAMQDAYDAAMKYEPVEIRYWSSKWVIGARKNGYSAKFIQSLKGA